MSFKKYIEKLQWADYRLPKRDKDNYTSFIEGFLIGKNDEPLAKLISLYLNKVHQINIEYNTWIEQLDHYAYKQNPSMSLVDALVCVLQELENYQGDLLDEIDHSIGELINWEEGKGKEQDKVNLKNGTIVKVGDFICLADKIGDDYKYTRFHDASLRNPSWDLLYPSGKDFEEVYFYVDGEDSMTITNFGRVRRIFSSLVSKIEVITTNGDLTIYTDVFKINVEQALEKQEIEIISDHGQKIEATSLSDLREDFQYFALGLITPAELFRRDSFSRLPLRNKSWYKYHQGINGDWHENT
ncbi:hypothetical protein BKI52_19110 [marine bacterium AO1-C]|nr:hypothetical protein BKI52_19110 [marine bacterium AO1-C]